MQIRSAKFLRVLPLVWLSACATVSPRASEEPLIYRHHSAGAEAILQSAEGLKFKEVWSLAPSTDLRKQVIQSVAGVVARQIGAPSSSSNLTSLLVPLVADLVERETVVEVRGSRTAPDWFIAVRLPEPRRQAWQSAIRSVLAEAKLPAGSSASVDGYPGWKVALPKLRLSWANANDWLLLSLAPGASPAWTEAIAQLKQSRNLSPIATGKWLTVNADLALLRQTFPLIPEFADSKLELAFGPKGENVRTDAKLQFSSPLGWAPEPWQIPTNTIRDPIVGFSTARGIRPLLLKSEEKAILPSDAIPNQATVWALPKVPYFLFGAYPQENVSNLVYQTVPKLPTVITNHGRLSGQLLWATNTGELYWQGLPFMAPTVKSLVDGGREFLFAQMLPMPVSPKKPPAELFAFMSRTNLAYYDWEITQERLMGWRKIYQVGLLAFMRQSPVTNAPSQRLLDELSVGKRLGNSITEVSVTGPSELTFMRYSPVGLTGVEIVSALRWLDSSNFPFTWESTPFMDMKKLSLEHRAARGTNAPPKGLRPAPPLAPPSARPVPPRSTNSVAKPKAVPAPPPLPTAPAPKQP